jgi:hypothetical protein
MLSAAGHVVCYQAKKLHVPVTCVLLNSQNARRSITRESKWQTGKANHLLTD